MGAMGRLLAAQPAPSASRAAPRAAVAPRRPRAAAAAAAASAPGGVEAVAGLRPEIDAAVTAALGSCLTETNLGVGKKYRGKVRAWD
jgi:hypothetical protein